MIPIAVDGVREKEMSDCTFRWPDSEGYHCTDIWICVTVRLLLRIDQHQIQMTYVSYIATSSLDPQSTPLHH